MMHRATLLLLSFAVFVALAQPTLAAQAPLPVETPPIPPSPIEDFRRWLKMSTEDREKALAVYPAAKQQVLRAKLAAYELMRPEQQDYRLRMLELRWYLLPLMTTTPAARGNYLALIPARLHSVITARLQRWDSLNEEIRRELLADENKRQLVTSYFAHVPRHRMNSPDLQRDSPPNPPGLAELKRWEQATPEGREKMHTHLSTFLGLPKSDQDKALDRLSERERQEMQKTLEVFARLSPQDRRACVDSFQRLATMAPEERASFLRNAARWQQLTPQERATWRTLVHTLPPMPPEAVVPPPFPQEEIRAENTLAETNASAPLPRN